MVVAVALCGCRAAGTGSLSLYPRPLPARGALDLDTFIAEHNRNAERIESLEAKPSITVLTANHAPVHVDGRMALERPRNFKLELSHFGTTKADIGSNDEEFWFWVASKEDRSLYWCNHDELESSALAATYQPDWIIDALGLKPISADEARQIQLEEGREPGTTALVFPASRKQGETYTRVMIVTNRDRRIKEYRVLAGASKVPVAQAIPSRYKEFAAAGTAEGAGGETCVLPERVRLDWKRDQLVLDAALQEVKLNQFNHARSASLFTEPTIEGYQRRNLAELTRAQRRGPRSRIRQTLPAPDPAAGAGEDAGPPAPGADDGPVVPKLGRATRRGRTPTIASAPSATTEAPPPLEELVGAPAPRAPVSQAALWASSRVDGLPLER
jgi:hypothetical protein